MIIQLSGLAFAHEDEALADSFVEAVESNVRETGGKEDAVPDYVSLLGTLQACRQQTAGFRWASLYEAVERKLHAGLMPKRGPYRAAKKRKVEVPKMPESVTKRALPFQILMGILRCLLLLQRFPDEGLLHLRSSSGISTIVVWCHHILGLSLVVRFQNAEVRFGETTIGIVIEECESSWSSATYMNPTDRHEPLFCIEGDEMHRRLEQSSEIRAEAFGFGRAVLKSTNLTEAEASMYSIWIISRSLRFIEPTSRPPHDQVDSQAESHAPNEVSLPVEPGEGCIETAEERGASGVRVPHLSREDIVRAGTFLFGLERDDYRDPEDFKEMTEPRYKTSRCRQQVDGLVAILFTFARINASDLPNCATMPLSVGICLNPGSYLNSYSTETISKRNGLLMAFDLLSRLLFGHSFSPEYVKTAVLVSAWGWSIYFDSVALPDPGDVSLTSMHVICGVPARRGLRRNRIIDGPTDESDLRAKHAPWSHEPPYSYKEGMSTAYRGVTLAGLHEDAFQVTQTFQWRPEHDPKKCSLGFRKMQEACLQFDKLSPCPCEEAQSKVLIRAKFAETQVLLDNCCWKSVHWSLSSRDGEMIIEVGVHDQMTAKPWPTKYDERTIVPFYVARASEARWLQLYRVCQEPLEKTRLALRGCDTCVKCAIKMAANRDQGRTWLLL